MNKLTLFAIVAFGFVMQGCSTPAGTGGSDDYWYSEMREEAWSAYSNCVDQLSPYGRQAECDQVASNSYDVASNRNNQYQQNYYQQGYYQPVYVQPPQQYYGQDPYYNVVPPHYIYSAEPSEVDAMTREWIELAEQPRM